MSLAIHEAVSKNPEQDLMYWVMRRVPLWRLTCRHASEGPNHSPSICHTKDGRWFITHGMGARDLKNLVPLLANTTRRPICSRRRPTRICGRAQVPGTAGSDESARRTCSMWCSALSAPGPTRTCRGCEAQEAGLLWAPLRKPHENALDEHWLARNTFAEIEHPELGRSLPLPDQQMAQQQDELAGRPPRAAARRGHRGGARRGGAAPAACRHEPRRVENPRRSALHDKPFPLQGIRIFDFAWFLASAGGTRFLAAMGAESYQGRVEGQSRHAARGDGAGRRPRRARCRDRAAAGGQGPRHGRQFPQQELRQARHLAQYPPPEGACRSPRT